MSGQVKLLKKRKGSVTVTVRMSAQVNGWTSKTVERTKEIGDCDSEKEWTSKTVERTKGIGYCDNKNEWKIKLL